MPIPIFQANFHKMDTQVVCTQIRSVALSAGAPRNPISSYAAVSPLPLRWNRYRFVSLGPGRSSEQGNLGPGGHTECRVRDVIGISHADVARHRQFHFQSSALSF